MLYLIVSAVVVIACASLSVKMLSFIKAERLAQRSRATAVFDAHVSSVSATARRPAASRLASAPLRSDKAPLARMRAAADVDTRFGFSLACGAAVAGIAVIGMGAACGMTAFGLAGALLIGGGSYLWAKRQGRRRAALFDRQLAQALPRIAASVRGSLTLERALRVAVIHMEDPLREEFIRVLSDTAYGKPLHEALEAMAMRTRSDDVKTLAHATRVRQGSGGSVSAVLALIANRVDGRLKAASEYNVEIAGTRIAKWFVAAAMPVLFLIMYLTNVDFARFYAEEPLGWAVLGVAATMEAAGLLMSHGITTVERA